jgi:Zn-dependent protease
LRPWKLGILITLFLAFLSNGYLPFLAYSGVYIYHLKLERLGRFRYYTNLSEHATISMMGPMANLLLAIVFKMLIPLNPFWMYKAMVINLLLALMNMIPIPPFDGADIFYWSTLRYAFCVVFFGTLAFLLYLTNMVWDAVWIAALLGAVGWFIFGTRISKEFFDPDMKG